MALALLICRSGVLSCQVLTGHVTDDRSAPVSGVRITFVGLQGAKHVTSGADGEFPIPPGLDSAVISARKIGYAPVDLFWRRGSMKNLALQMRGLRGEQVVSLDRVITRDDARLCPIAESVAARGLWMRAVGRYATDTRNLPYRVRVTTVDDEATGPFAESEHLVARSDGTLEGYAVGNPAGGQRRMEYARRVDVDRTFGRDQPGRGRIDDPQYFAWKYLNLEAASSSHFAEPSFALWHTFGFQQDSEPGGTRVIVFCPVGDRPPGSVEIEGALSVSADTLFREAVVRFLSPEPNEDAGIQVTFDTSLVGPRRLLATRSLFWRRISGGTLYARRSRIMGPWRITARTPE